MSILWNTSLLMSIDYDAVVIGSGPNGLAAAIQLAINGWKILVIEARETIGGGTRTKDLTLSGFRHDVCSAVHPMALASPFFTSLNLEAHGLSWVQSKIPLGHPLDHGRAVLLHRSLAETCDGLGVDGGAYRRVFEPLTRQATSLFEDLLKPFGIPRHPIRMARFGVRALLPATTLARFFRTAEARALFAGTSGHSVRPLHQTLTSAVGIVLQVAAHVGGWPIPAGGSQEIANVLARVLVANGGAVTCGCRVERFEELPPARAYLFDVSPRQLSRICGDALPAAYRQRLEAYRHGPGVFKVDYALSEPIPWSNAACRSAGTVHVGGSFEEIAAAERAAWDGSLTETPFVLVAQPSVSDPTRAPAGRHVGWAYCHVPSGSTVSRRDCIESQIERYAPGFRDCILAAHTLNCAEMEEYNPNYIGGDIIGGVTDWRQLFTRPVGLRDPYATPNPKIFLCSASTPPGGGVHGMCGYWAAQSVRRRWARA